MGAHGHDEIRTEGAGGVVHRLPAARRAGPGGGRACLRRRSAWAPALAVAVSTGLFPLSAFVIGPAISGTDDAPPPPGPTHPMQGPTDEHGH